MSSFPGLKQTLATLIAYKTVTGNNDEIRALLAWVKGELQGLPVFFREYECNGVPSLIVTTREGQKNPKVWLAAHVDVVDGPDPVWKPRMKEGRLYGRGAFDMKLAAASYIELFKEMGQLLADYDIGIMLTGDEEVGGYCSTQSLLDDEGYRGGVVMLPDGGDTWQFEEAAKGRWAFDLMARGKSAHSSRPWQGENAIHSLSQLLTELYVLAQDFWIDTPDHWHLTYNVGVISGGTAQNSIADSAVASIDVRFVSEEERKRFEDRAGAIIAGYPNISVKEECNEAPYSIARDIDAAHVFARIAKETYGIECGWSRAHGSSDARYFAQYGIPVLLIVPEAGGRHEVEEWVDLAGLERFRTVIGSWVKEIGRAEVRESSITLGHEEAHA